MQNNTEIILANDGFELIVEYDFEKGVVEDVTGVFDTKLKVVEFVFGGVGIDILPLMNFFQKEVIISKLTYEIQ